MLAKFNSNDMNTVASDAIHSYIEDGYHIDAKESVIDREKDKDCTFKAVLKKDVDGIACKTVITLNDNGDDKNKLYTYHKVDMVGDTKWSEESRAFSSFTDKSKLDNTVTRHFIDRTTHKTGTLFDYFDDSFCNWHHNTVKNIARVFGFDSDWFEHDDTADRCKRFDDIVKATKAAGLYDDKKDTSWKCKCPSAYQNTKADKPADNHIKVDAKDTVDDIYKKITTKKEPADDKRMDDIVDKVKASTTENKKVEDNLPKQDPDDTLEDSLIKLVRYLFSK